MKRIVLYVSDKCVHCKAAQQYLDAKKIPYRLTDAKTQRGRKELQAIGAKGVPVIKIADQYLFGFDIKAFDKMFNS